MYVNLSGEVEVGRDVNPFLLRGTGLVPKKEAKPPRPVIIREVDSAIYSNISCSDGVSTGKLNDNYCDCIVGGEDEPGTGACSWFTKPATVLYQCTPAKSHYLPSARRRKISIFNSRIHDGICDCSDCSDEKET